MNDLNDAVGHLDLQIKNPVYYSDRNNRPNSSIYFNDTLFNFFKSKILFCENFSITAWLYYSKSFSFNLIILNQISFYTFLSILSSKLNIKNAYNDLSFYQNKWIHICLVYNSPFAIISVNGTQITKSKLIEEPNCSDSYNDFIVKSNLGFNLFSNGVYDDVRIYNGALSVTDIKSSFGYVSIDYNQTLNMTSNITSDLVTFSAISNVSEELPINGLNALSNLNFFHSIFKIYLKLNIGNLESNSAKTLLVVKNLLSSNLNILDCLVNCSNNGICVINTNGDYLCECNQYYTGKDCSKDLRFCSTLQCLNNGTCMNIIEDAKYDFNCTCSFPYHGKRCERTYDLCQNISCSHNGLCKMKSIQPTCICFPGYLGSHCEFLDSKTKIIKTVKTVAVYSAILIICLFILIVIFIDISSSVTKAKKINMIKPN